MLADVALSKPNQRGNRAYGRFLKSHLDEINATDRELAQHMAQAFFSALRVSSRYEAAGIWIEDLFIEGQAIWLMDESLEASAPDGTLIGMRAFDAGAFYVGFGIAVPLDEESVELWSMSRREPGQRPPGRRLAPLIYGDAVHLRELVRALVANSGASWSRRRLNASDALTGGLRSLSNGVGEEDKGCRCACGLLARI